MCPSLRNAGSGKATSTATEKGISRLPHISNLENAQSGTTSMTWTGGWSSSALPWARPHMAGSSPRCKGSKLRKAASPIQQLSAAGRAGDTLMPTPDRQVPGRARYTPEREKATSRMILYKNNKNGGDSTIGLVSQATLPLYSRPSKAA